MFHPPDQQFISRVQFDETAIGGSEDFRHENKRLSNRKEDKPGSKRKKSLHGMEGKAIVIGAAEVHTGRIVGKVIPDSTMETFHEFVKSVAYKGATICTDENPVRLPEIF